MQNGGKNDVKKQKKGKINKTKLAKNGVKAEYKKKKEGKNGVKKQKKGKNCQKKNCKILSKKQKIRKKC